MKKILFFTLLTSSIYASEQKYTISVCTTQNLKNAEYCKSGIEKSMQGEVFIVQESSSRFYTYLNLYGDKRVADMELRNSSQFVKKQKPYVKKLSLADLEALNLEQLSKNSIGIEESVFKNMAVPNETTIQKPIEEVEITQNLVEELIDDAQLNSIPTDENPNFALEKVEFPSDKIEKSEKIEEIEEIAEIKEKNLPKAYVSNVDLNEFDKILIKVNSKTNIMELKGVKNSVETLIRTYIVATARAGVKKPQGKGNISEISLNPYWYPTPSIKKSFARKGINLPNVVPPNHKYNYMGAAKLNLTHSVNGDTSYRIHGTLNESTLGKNVSAGCIRMKNSEIVELTKAFQKIDLKRVVVDLF